MKIYDLSQPLNQDCSFWPFYPPFEVKYIKRKSEHGVNAQYIMTSNHMGTHLDAPFHFAEGKWTTEQIPLSRLIGPGVMIDMRRQAVHQGGEQLTDALGLEQIWAIRAKQRWQ